ncbi:MAG: TerC family protein [Anaerolineales bacterium]|nr:TerC family protein [Anaerolineales bacterium]
MGPHFDWITQPEGWVALLTLVALELVLGVDNIIFISILAGKLPIQDQQKVRTTGILAAVLSRVALLFSINWVIGLKEDLFTLPWFEIGISGKDIILIIGGLFLLWKSTHEIHEKLEGHGGRAVAKVAANFWGVVLQIMILDIVFSLDSVITAVGMAEDIAIMVIAVIVAALVMIFTARPISEFVEKHPTVKILALSFLLMIGLTLIADGFDQHIPKGYIYFAMAFSVFVEIINLRVRGDHVEPVHLRDPYQVETTPEVKPEVKPAVKPTAVKAPKPNAGRKQKPGAKKK